MIPRIAIFGTGCLVKLLIPFMQIKGFVIEALWGEDLQLTKDVALKLGIPYYTNSIDDVLLRKEVGLVLIFCSPVLHSQIAMKALGIGKHVLCDVPTALTQMEIFKMKTAAQYYPLLSALNFSLRFLPAFIQMKKAIKENYIGKVNVCDVRVQCCSLIGSQFDWHCDIHNGGGVLNVIGSHIIDVLSFVMDKKAIKACGMQCTFQTITSNIRGIRQISSDNFCTFQLKLQNDAVCSVTINSLPSDGFTQEVLIYGTEGHLCVRGGDLYGQKTGSSKEEVLYLEVEDLQLPQAQGLPNAVPKLYAKGTMKLMGSLRETFSMDNSLQQGLISTAANFEDGQYVQAVIEAIQQSNWRQEWCLVSIINEKREDIYCDTQSLLWNSKANDNHC